MSRKKQPVADDFDDTPDDGIPDDFSEGADAPEDEEDVPPPVKSKKKPGGEMKLVVGAMAVAGIGYYLYTTMLAPAPQEGMAPPVPVAQTDVPPPDAAVAGQMPPAALYGPDSSDPSTADDGDMEESENAAAMQLALPPVVAVPDASQNSAYELPPRPSVGSQPGADANVESIAIPKEDYAAMPPPPPDTAADAAADPFKTAADPASPSAVAVPPVDSAPAPAPASTDPSLPVAEGGLPSPSVPEPMIPGMIPVSPDGASVPAVPADPGMISAQDNVAAQAPAADPVQGNDVPAPADTAAQQRISDLEQTVRDLQAKLDSMAAVEKPASAKKPAVKKSSAPKKAAVKKNWIMKSARPGSAWLADGPGGALRQIYVGDSVEGIGTVTAVEKNEAGRWVVRGTKGSVAQ